MSLTSIKAGQATVEINADDSKLVKGLNAAKSHISSWVPSIGSIATAASAAAAAAGAGLAMLVKHAADTASEIQDLSDRTGISAKSISTLKYAAGQTGADLGGLQAAMKNIAKELASGGKSFEKYGINVERFRRLSPEDQFKVVAEAVSRVQDPTERAAVAMELFGKAGQDLLPLVSGGAAGIEKLQRQAERLGLSMSNEAAAAGEEFGDSLETLGNQVAAIGTKIGTELIPHLQPLIDKVIEASAEFLHWADSGSEALDKFLSSASETTGAIIDQLRLMTHFISNGGIQDSVNAVAAMFKVGLYNDIATFIDEFQALWDSQFVQYIAKTSRNVLVDAVEYAAKAMNPGDERTQKVIGFMADAGRNTDTSAKSVSGIARKAALEAAVEAKAAVSDLMMGVVGFGEDMLDAQARKELADMVNGGDKFNGVVGDRKRGIDTKPARAVETDQAKMTMASVGTFNARAAGGLAGNSDTAAIRVATQQTARNTARLAAAGGAAAVVFGA